MKPLVLSEWAFCDWSKSAEGDMNDRYIPPLEKIFPHASFLMISSCMNQKRTNWTRANITQGVETTYSKHIRLNRFVREAGKGGRHPNTNLKNVCERPRVRGCG